MPEVAEDEDLLARVDRLQAELDKVSKALGVDSPPPQDLKDDRRWDVSMREHFIRLRDYEHDLRNVAGGLMNAVRLLRRDVAKLEPLTQIMSPLTDAVHRLGPLVHQVEAQFADRRITFMSAFYADTLPTEAALAVCMLLEGLVLVVAGERFTERASIWHAMVVLLPSTLAWGLLMILTGASSLTAIGCQWHWPRRIAAYWQMAIFGTIAGISMLFTPNTWGWVQHGMLFAGALWVARRGPAGGR